VQQEYSSLATLLILRFRLYFAPKEADAVKHETLFKLCGNAMKDYVVKETKLSEIKREQLSIAQTPAENTISRRASQASQSRHDDDTQLENLEETIPKGSSDADLQRLKMQEGVLVK